MNTEAFRIQMLEKVAACASRIVSTNFSHIRLSINAPDNAGNLEELPAEWIDHLPACLSALFFKIAVRFEFSWTKKDAYYGPEMICPIGLGFVQWDLAKALDLAALKRSYERGCDFEYLWQDKYPLLQFVNGDFIAVSVDSPAGEERVFYLTPNNVDNSIVSFDHDLFEFLLLWGDLGYPSDVTLLQFRDERSGCLKLDTECAKGWMRWLRKE